VTAAVLLTLREVKLSHSRTNRRNSRERGVRSGDEERHRDDERKHNRTDAEDG